MILAKAIGRIFHLKGYGGAHLAGRALAGIFDLLTVWLVYRITRRFAGRRASLLAAGLSSFCVLGIQLSHFWNVDAFLASFTAATLLGAVRIAQARLRLARRGRDRRRAGLGGRMQDHGARAAAPGGNRVSRPDDPRARPGLAAGRSGRGGRAADRRRRDGRHHDPHLPSPCVQRTQPLLLPPGPEVDRRFEAADPDFQLGRGVPSGAAVGGPDDLFPGRKFRAVRGRRLLRGRRHRGDGLDGGRPGAPARARPGTAVRVRALPLLLPRADASSSRSATSIRPIRRSRR